MRQGWAGSQRRVGIKPVTTMGHELRRLRETYRDLSYSNQGLKKLGFSHPLPHAPYIEGSFGGINSLALPTFLVLKPVLSQGQKTSKRITGVFSKQPK